MPDILVQVKGLKKYFPIKSGILARTSGWVHAVDGVDFTIRKGETLSLVGESGSGKTTLGQLILGLIQPTEGEVCFEGQDIFAVGQEELRKLRREMQMVFQDQSGSLDPRMKVGQLIKEPLVIHNLYDNSERDHRVLRILERVGLNAEHLDRYPHEFSGGQRQRISIARALILKPKFIVADEPVSALDVSIRSEVLNLLKDLQDEFDLTYLLISHDLSVVKHMSSRVAVMYGGKIVEFGTESEVFRSSKHPYTEALISAIPIPDPEAKKQRIVLEGESSSPINPPIGCRFAARCPYKMTVCETEEPKLLPVGAEHVAACHLNKIEAMFLRS